MSAPGVVVHIVGPEVQIGTRRRQRCSWCGTLLEDMDLANMAVPVEYGPDGEELPWEGPPGWPVGALMAVDSRGVVAVEGDTALSLAVKSIVEHEDGAVLPEEACGRLPDEMTGTG